MTRHALLVGSSLALLVAVVFGQTLRHDFINYDDNTYVYENPHVTTGLTAANVRWALTTPYRSNWQPLTWISYMVDQELYGLWAGGFHLTNVLLHLASVLLLFTLLRSATGALWRSALVAGLFALHPLHVEPVAWIASRKDVLSMFFGLLTLLAYVRYARRPGLRRMLAVIVLLALGLMSKAVLVTLPAVMLLLDYWPLARMRGSPAAPQPAAPRPRYGLGRLILEKLPLLALAAGAAIMTVRAQNIAGGVLGAEALTLPQRIGYALASYLEYLRAVLWPAHLAVPYPHPGLRPLPLVIGSAAVLATITLAVLVSARRRPYLPVGWFWFAGTLVPVIFRTQFGRADRFTYFPLIGLYLMVAWGVGDLLGRTAARRRVAAVAAVLVLVLCTGLSFLQTRRWRNSVTLFAHAVRHTSRNAVAHNNLGDALVRGGKIPEAVEHFRAAVRAMPQYEQGHLNLGNALVALGRPTEALEAYGQVLRLDPRNVDALYRKAAAQVAAGQARFALATCEEALALRPDDALGWFHKGIVLEKLDRPADALAAYGRALELDNRLVAAWGNQALVLAGQNRLADALASCGRALALAPREPLLWRSQGAILERSGRLPEALASFDAAVQLQPEHPENWLGKARLHAALRQHEQARAAARECRARGGRPPIELLEAGSPATAPQQP